MFCYHDDGFGGETTIAVVEQVLERRSKEINDEDVVKAFLAEVVHVRYAG